MTQHIENLNIGDKLTFVGPKGRIHYRNDGEFNITLGLGTTSTVTGLCLIRYTVIQQYCSS